jgi:hypothetical protein
MKVNLNRIALWTAVAPGLFLQFFAFGNWLKSMVWAPAPIVVPLGSDAGAEFGGRLLEATIPMLLIAMTIPFFWCLAGCLLLISFFLKRIVRNAATPKIRQMTMTDRIACWLLIGPALVTGAMITFLVIMYEILAGPARAMLFMNPIGSFVMLLLQGSVIIVPVAWFAAACLVIAPRLRRSVRNDNKKI